MGLRFSYMNENDLYDADRVCNENFRKIEDNVMESQVMTKEEYDAVPIKTADKFYAVRDGGRVSLYLGNLPIVTGEVPVVGSSSALYKGTDESFQGTAKYDAVALSMAREALKLEMTMNEEEM
ncbi:MAG: hypothetical protein IK999_18840 [Ruminococcus sp.]|nr:hypothetical protein [Ruminococcus sp.]